MRRERGAALILALGILALLTMLVVSFSLLTQVETSAATNYREGERAKTLAKSGIERAQAELRRAVVTPGFPLPWLMYDGYEYSTNTRLEPARQAKPSLFDVGIKPSGTNPGIKATRSPSFGMYVDITKMPKALTDISVPWPSGVLGGTYYTDPDNPMFRGDYYSLRVIDVSSQLFVNDESPQLANMIDDLVWAWGVKLGGQPGATPGLGAKIVAGRPADGYHRIEELYAITGISATDKTTLDGITQYLTCVARVDQKVVEMGNQPALGPIGAHQAYLSIQPRAAVNVNTAAVPVLVAVLSRITSPNGPIGQTLAYQIAEKIVDYRANPLLTDEPAPDPSKAGNPATQRWGFQRWGEFKAFLMVNCGLNEATADTVLANVNPNTDLNKFVPDEVIDHTYDKNDLTSGTTEFCFAPQGLFLVESLGVVLDPTGKPIATAKARAIIRAFERYVETTQADFESGRVDPPGANGLVGLRDIASLPEARNAIDAKILGDLVADEKTPAANAGMHAAEYDGQLTFNVITRTKVAQPLGVFVGFIDRTLDGTRADGGSSGPITHAGAARSLNTGQTLGLVLDDGNPTNPNQGKRRQLPNFTSGSDYHALAGFLGRTTLPPNPGTMPAGAATGRELQYDQDEVVKGEQFTYNDTVVSIPVTQQIRAVFSPGPSIQIGKIDFTVQERITDWDYNPIFRQGFEFWFKPARRTDNPSKIILLDWMAGGAQHPVVNTEDTMPSYNAEPVNGGTASFGGVTATFNAAFYDATIPNVVPNPTHQNSVTWGAGARLSIWLEPSGTNTYTIHARFKITKAYDPSARFQGNYDKTWTSTGSVIHTGTWHHALFTWEAPVSKADCPGEHSFFFVDGNHMTADSEPDWPTEIEPKGQYIIAAIMNLREYIAAIAAAEAALPGGGLTAATVTPINYGPAVPPDPEIYRAPVQLAAAPDDVYIGCAAPGLMPDAPDFGMASSPRYLGLMDNICFHSKWNKQIPTSDLENCGANLYLPRYDTYRPTQGGDPKATGTFKALTFTKHTQALDWDRPIRIVAYDVTAWKHVGTNTAQSVDSTKDAGRVFFRFGWANQVPQPDGVNPNGAGFLAPDINGTYNPETSPSGWTQRLNGVTGTPWNAIANGYLLPTREPNGRGGFLTKGQKEYTLYAIEMYPFAEAQTGPRMAPVVDDVNVVYLRWDCGTVLEEEEVVDTE